MDGHVIGGRSCDQRTGNHVMGIFMLVMVWEISRCGMRSKLMEAMVSCTSITRTVRLPDW